MTEIVLARLAGAVVAGLAAWWLGHGRARRAELAAARAGTESAVAGERTRAAERELEAVRAAAAQLEARLAGLQEERRRLEVERGELQTLLEAERRVAAEKLAVLDDAQTPPVRRPSRPWPPRRCTPTAEQLLDLARQALAAQTAEARGDLDERQAAIEGAGGAAEGLAGAGRRPGPRAWRRRASRPTASCASRSGRSTRRSAACAPRPRTWSRRCASRRCAAAGARCSCSASSSWPG